MEAKRSRSDVEEVEESSVGSQPEAKRIRTDFMFDILDDESRPDNERPCSGPDPDPAIDDLYSVMRSLEEEIATTALPPSSCPDSTPTTPSDPSPNQPDLGFLLEASDDELGLPPPGGIAEASDDVGGASDDVGFGKIWGFDDDFHLVFGFGSEERDYNGSDDGPVIFDGGLFDCAVAPEFSDLTWRTGFLPAV